MPVGVINSFHPKTKESFLSDVTSFDPLKNKKKGPRENIPALSCNLPI
jgi:hypothetical protein